MSIANDLAVKLTFGLPDRLGKALNVADITAIEMAEYLGVSRTTISNYTNGRTPVKKQTLRLWAMRTGVPLEWLESGHIAGDPNGGNAVTGLYQKRNSQLGDSNIRQIFTSVSSRRNEAA